MLLPSLISLRRPASIPESPEDILGSSLGGIFTDDLQCQHGDYADTVIVYKSAVYGDLEFRTADVQGEEQRRKFAHYLWNAGILVAELVGGREKCRDGGGDRDSAVYLHRGEDSCAWWVDEVEEMLWSVQDETVLELGAGPFG